MSEKRSYELWNDEEWRRYEEKRKPFSQQFMDVMREDPGIPIFMGATVAALTLGLRQSFVVRDSRKAGMYMLMRVSAQGLAAGAVGWSIYKAFDPSRVAKREAKRAAEEKQKLEQLQQQ